MASRGKFVGLYVTGDKAIDKLLRGMPENLQKKYLAKASEVAIKKIVLPRAKATVPQSDPSKKKSKGQPGDLRRGIKTYKLRARRGQIGWKLHVGAPGYHASLIELGTRDRFTKKSGSFRGAISKPSEFAFLRRAMYEQESQIRKKFLEFVAAFIKAQNAKIGTVKHLIPK